MKILLVSAAATTLAIVLGVVAVVNLAKANYSNYAGAGQQQAFCFKKPLC